MQTLDLRYQPLQIIDSSSHWPPLITNRNEWHGSRITDFRNADTDCFAYTLQNLYPSLNVTAMISMSITTVQAFEVASGWWSWCLKWHVRSHISPWALLDGEACLNIVTDPYTVVSTSQNWHHVDWQSKLLAGVARSRWGKFRAFVCVQGVSVPIILVWSLLALQVHHSGNFLAHN